MDKFRICVPKYGHVGEKYKYGHPHEPNIIQWMKTLVRPGDTVIDVGANIGIHTLYFSREVGSTGSVWAFEPDPMSFHILQNNLIENNCWNVKAFRIAIMDTIGERILHIREDNSESNSFFPLNDGKNKEIGVKTSILDEILSNVTPNLIKLDIEGAEALAIDGAKALIRRCPKLYLMMELFPKGLEMSSWSIAKLADLLDSLAFNCFYFLDLYRGACQQIPSIRILEKEPKEERTIFMILCVK